MQDQAALERTISLDIPRADTRKPSPVHLLNDSFRPVSARTSGTTVVVVELGIAGPPEPGGSPGVEVPGVETPGMVVGTVGKELVVGPLASGP